MLAAATDIAPTGRRVLLVEDDGLVRLVASELLALAGFAVVEAADAEAAMSYLGRGNVPDVLVTDIQMPGPFDGLALADMVAARWPHVGILVCSSHTRPSADELPMGARFLAKPHAPGALVRQVTDLAPRPEPALVSE